MTLTLGKKLSGGVEGDMVDNLNPIFNETKEQKTGHKLTKLQPVTAPIKRKRSPRKDKGHDCKFPVPLELQMKYKTSLKRFKYHFPEIEIQQTKYNTLLLLYALNNLHIIDWNLEYPGTSTFHMTTKLPEYKFEDISGEYGLAMSKGLSYRETVFMLTTSALHYIEKGGYYAEIQQIGTLEK